MLLVVPTLNRRRLHRLYEQLFEFHHIQPKNSSYFDYTLSVTRFNIIQESSHRSGKLLFSVRQRDADEKSVVNRER